MKKYKRFIVFEFPDHYPNGGSQDITGSFDSLVDAKESVKLEDWDDCFQIFDCENRQFVDGNIDDS